MIAYSYRYVAAAALLAALGAGSAQAETVALPVKMDYQMLTSILLRQMYTGPNRTAVALDKNDGCQRVTLAKPQVAPDGPYIRIGSEVSVTAGTYLLGECVMPIEWDGWIEVTQRVWMDEGQWVVRFETVDSYLYDAGRRPATLTDILWRLVRKSVHQRLDELTVDLSPSVEDLKAFLAPLFPEKLRERSGRLLDSLRPGGVTVTAREVRAEILMDVEPRDLDEVVVEEALSEEELNRFVDVWEAWDAFLVFQINAALKRPLSEDDRRVFIDTLLETRHRFVTELTGEHGGKDFVRTQFVASWSRLAPIFRTRLTAEPSDSLLLYLSFFTASDALVTLDRLGPALGMEISRNGLLRLARLLNEGAAAPLEYDAGVDPQLRRLFGLGAPLKVSGPALDVEEIEIEQPEEGRLGARISGLLLNLVASEACAAAGGGEVSKSQIDMIRRWLLAPKNTSIYMKRIKRLLREAAAATVESRKPSEGMERLFMDLTLSTAWQESCFRQFTMKKRKVTYLRSYNGTSVGLMQINERVWRGMYDPKSLRWNIYYNAMAGCEILDLYLNRYALKKSNRKDPLPSTEI